MMPIAARWLFGVSMAAATMALADAAPAEEGDAPRPGYYRVDRDSLVTARETGDTDHFKSDSLQGRTDREITTRGRTVQQSFASKPEHTCVVMALSRKLWESDGTQLQRLGPDQWQLTYPPFHLGSKPQDMDKLRRTMSDERMLRDMNMEKRAAVKDAARELPKPSDAMQAYADLAAKVEAAAATKQGAEAEALREQARRLRDGTIGENIATGKLVERWTRIADHCPAGG